MKVLAISDYNENKEILDKLLVRSILKNIDVILFSGNIIIGKKRIHEWTDSIDNNRRPVRNIDTISEEINNDASEYQLFYEKLIKADLPVMLIPGKFDAPEKKYLSFIDFFERTSNLNLIHRNLVSLNNFIYMGFGGQIMPEERKLENYFILQYSAETVKYSLRKIKYRAGSKILLFHSAPENKENWDEPCENETTLKSIINEINPVLVVAGSQENGKPYDTVINNGKSILAQPGKLCEGNYSMINLDNKKVKHYSL